MRPYLFIPILLISTLATFAQNPYTRGTRAWNQTPAQIKSFYIKSTIDGLMTRNEMEISFKSLDEINDSTELYFSFSLPQNSVIDSMYLWIDGKPQIAALKERWSAVRQYNQIVGRRIDPALLQKMWWGDGYQLQIFPFKKTETRKVRICYSSTLSASNGTLQHIIPIDMVQNSKFPVEVMKVVVDCDTSIYDKIDGNSLFSETYTVAKNGSRSIITISSSNILPSHPLTFPVYNKQFSETGSALSVSKTNVSDPSFVALIEPKKALNIEESPRKKNVYVIWNLVSNYQNCNWDFYNTSKCNPYETTTIYAAYTNSMIEALKKFIETYMSEGDEFNIAINDGSFKVLASSPKKWTNTLNDELKNFVLTKIDTSYRNSNLLKPMDFMKTAIGKTSGMENVDIILIDQTYSYAYILDTLKVDAYVDTILRTLPSKTTLFGLISYSWNSPVSRIQNAILSKKGGMGYYAWGDLNQIFTSIGKALTPQLYPASINFMTNRNSYIYDIITLNDNRFQIGIPIIYTGKIHGSPDSITMQFNGSLQNTDYSMTTKTKIPVNNRVGSALPWVEKIWAAKKVSIASQMSRDYALTEYQEATNLSLRYRILTDLTALLALEPGRFDSSWYVDDQAKNSGGQSTAVNKSQKSGFDPDKMQVSVDQNFVTIKLPDLDSRQGISLKIYDLRGRLVLDLTGKLKNLHRMNGIKVPLNSFSKGTYILEVKYGNKILQKQFVVKR